MTFSSEGSRQLKLIWANLTLQGPECIDPTFSRSRIKRRGQREKVASSNRMPGFLIRVHSAPILYQSLLNNGLLLFCLACLSSSLLSSSILLLRSMSLSYSRWDSPRSLFSLNTWRVFSYSQQASHRKAGQNSSRCWTEGVSLRHLAQRMNPNALCLLYQREMFP